MRIEGCLNLPWQGQYRFALNKFGEEEIAEDYLLEQSDNTYDYYWIKPRPCTTSELVENNPVFLKYTNFILESLKSIQLNGNLQSRSGDKVHFGDQSAFTVVSFVVVK